MNADEIYTALLNAGFAVEIIGTMFIVSLINRPVRPMEVEIALSHPRNVRYGISGDATVVMI